MGMAGITLPLKYVDRFKKLNTKVEMQLHVQEMDGYPKRLTDSEVADIFGPLRPLNPPIHDGWDLKECNNRLVTYIDRARVLRQAYELKKSLSEVQLTDRTSIVVSETNNAIFEQMNKIKSMRAEAARRRIEVEQRRNRLRDIMSRLSIYSVTKETEFDEVSAYQQLLDFETVRMSQPERKHRATVRTSTARRSASTSANTSGYAHSSQTKSQSRVSYRKRDSSADSGKGYSKAATPDGTLDGSFGELGGRNSGFLDDLKKDVY